MIGAATGMDGARPAVSSLRQPEEAYDHLDWEWCLKIMIGYGVGPKLLCLQTNFWNQAKMVCHDGGSLGKPFGAFRGVTQGGPLSSLMFKVYADAVIRELFCWMLDKETTYGRFE
jgi:hypothetical protein